MKTISSYILEDELLNNVYLHVLLEFKFNHDTYPIVLESLGKFNNAGITIKHIIGILKDNFESQVIDCSEDKVYFNKIDIEIDISLNGGATYTKSNDDTVYIVIHCKSKDFFNEHIDDYAKTLLHELLHGYEDYNRKKNNGDSIFNYLNDKYKKSFDNLNSSNEIKAWFSRCYYFLNEQERNAYMTQLEHDIEKLFKEEKINIEDFNYSDFKDRLKKMPRWKTYFDIANFIMLIYKTNWNNTQKKYIENIWKELYDEDKHFNDIRKEIYRRWNKFERKFEQLVPKIICKHITTNLNEVYVDVDKIR